MRTKTITVYEGFWNNELFSRSRTYSKALKRITNSLEYGESDDPETICYGTKWAEDENDTGWRIRERQVEALVIDGEVSGSLIKKETVHLIWTCPLCEESWSDDFTGDEVSPVMVRCGCVRDGIGTYILVNFEYTDPG